MSVKNQNRIVNRVDLEETDHMSRLIRIYTVCIGIWFWSVGLKRLSFCYKRAQIGALQAFLVLNLVFGYTYLSIVQSHRILHLSVWHFITSKCFGH